MSREPDRRLEPECEADDTQALQAVTPPRMALTPPAWLLILLVVGGALAGALLGLRAHSDEAAVSALPAATQRLIAAVSGPVPEEKLVFATSPAPPLQAPDLLPSGTPAVYCFYDIPGVRATVAPTVKWSKDGKPVGVLAPGDINPGKRAGSGMIALRAPAGGGFEPGIYEVQLTFPDAKVTGSFVTAVGAGQIIAEQAPKDTEVLITGPVCGTGVDKNGQVVGPGKSFNGRQRIYFVFGFKQAEPGSAVVVKWYGGQQEIASARHEVVLPSVEGQASAWLQAPPPGLPDGAYRASVAMEGDTKQLAEADFTVSAANPLPAASSRSAPKWHVTPQARKGP